MRSQLFVDKRFNNLQTTGQYNICFLQCIVSDEISVEAGFKVQIHVQDEPPFIHELGFGISPGFQTLVATQEQRVGVSSFAEKLYTTFL